MHRVSLTHTAVSELLAPTLIQVLEEEVEENFATRLADAMTGDAEDMTPLIWVFAFGIILVVVSAVTGMVIMSSILKSASPAPTLGDRGELCGLTREV